MGYFLRVERTDIACLLTTRSRNSKLWFIKNEKLHYKICAYLAKLQEKYKVEIYALNIQGNHYHLLARFPYGRRSDFMRDFNSQFTRYVKLHVSSYEGGGLWARRYAEQAVPRDMDIEKEFFYCALQPVLSGLCRRISEYQGYNSFSDAVHGVERKYKLVAWGEFNSARRYNRHIHIADYTTVYTLKFNRLPSYENLSQKEYSKLMHAKLEEQRQQVVARREENGEGFAGTLLLRKTPVGARPFKTKTSNRYDFRPIVLTTCSNTRREYTDWYFMVWRRHSEASCRYRSGEICVEFPSGTYKPVCFLPVPST